MDQLIWHLYHGILTPEPTRAPIWHLYHGILTPEPARALYAIKGDHIVLFTNYRSYRQMTSLVRLIGVGWTDQHSTLPQQSLLASQL